MLKIDCRGNSSYMHILLFIMVVWSCNAQNDILNYNIVVNFKELNQKELNMMSECVPENLTQRIIMAEGAVFGLAFGNGHYIRANVQGM